jgi:hypothetical protein
MGKSYNKDNQHAIKHGGAAAAAAISRNEPFSGVAKEAQERVETQLSLVGSLGVERDLMVRLITATDLYWDALIAAVDAKDNEKIDRYTQRFGWLVQGSLRAVKQYVEHQKSTGDDPIDAQIILDTYRKGEEDA